MQLFLVIMAQIISFTSLLAFIFINYQLWRSADSQIYSHLSDAFLEQEVTYDELYQSGMQSYTNEDWSGTIWFFERALQEFNYYRTSLTECRLKCQNLTHVAASGGDALSEMRMFEAVFRKADCTRRCKLQKLGGRSERIDDAVTDKFLSMTPYSYLQFAYYKSGLYEQAVAAAYTYLQWHPEDEVMHNNLDYYRNMHGIAESQLVNLEEKPHHRHFLAGYQAYQDEEWSAVIADMEGALREYWSAMGQCRALCEGKYDNREFMDLYEAIANHYASTLYCKDQCDDWLARINGKQIEDYLPSHFHFLQFAYYKTDDLQNAIRNAMAYLLFHPKDEVMLQNLAFYENDDDNDEGADYAARPDARAYHETAALETKLLNFAQEHFWNDDAEEFLFPDKEVEEEEESGLDYLGAEPINPQEVNLKQDEGEVSEKTEGGRGSEGDAAVEIAGHADERRSAKYSRDLNHEGAAGDQEQTPGRQRGPSQFPQSDAQGKGSADVRSRIMNGMKKILQSMMGTSEDESQQLLLQLARDPNSNEVREKIKVAIEKMMASGEMEKAFPREQLKTLIQGLSQGDLADSLGKMDLDSEDPPPVENFDPDSVRKHHTDSDEVLLRNSNVEMLDIKDYNPMKGLDKKEYFDWVNPPGYEAGAPGSPDDDDDDDREVEENDAEFLGNHAISNENVIGDREYYPSDDEDIGSDQDQGRIIRKTDPSDESYDIHKEFILKEEDRRDDVSNDDKGDDVCVSESNCARSSANNQKDNIGNGEEQEEEKAEDNGENYEEEDGKCDGGNFEKDVHSDGGDDDCSCHEECLQEDAEDEDYLDEDDDEGGDEPLGGLSLTPEEASVQQMLDEDEITAETKEWMDDMMKIDDNAYFLLDDLNDLDVVMKDEELNGSNRVVVDGVAADQECGVLLQLLDGEGRVGNGYKGKPNPHTKYEHFEGLTVKDAVDAASKGRIPLLYPTVYMHLAERSRQFLQRHFRLKTHLFFSFTHLVCRQAEPGSMHACSHVRRRDLSHPVHADNCNLDRRGRCHKKLPAFVWRDWSAILYLNQDFEGGEFIFAHFNQTAQSVVTPKCGRLVGFSAGSENLHGVKGVIQGRRCALAMWFTLDPRFREMEFFRAADHLNLLYEEEYSQEEYY